MNGQPPIGSPNDPIYMAKKPNSSYQPTYELPEGIIPDYFVYQFPIVQNLAILVGTAQVQVQIQNDADFEMRAISYYYEVAAAQFTGATRPVPNWNLMLTETGSGRNLFSAPVPVASIAWNGEGSMRHLPWPKIFSRNANIVATFVNFDAAIATGQMFLTLHGRKLFATK